MKNVLILLLILGAVCTSCLEKITDVPLSLSISVSSIEFSPSSEVKSFSITSNTNNWNVVSSASSWLTVEPASGSNDGTVFISVAANTGTTARPATITVTGTGVPDQTIQVTQSPTLSLTLSPSTLSFSSDSEVKTFNITSNTNWTVNSNASSWLTISPTSGSNNGTVRVTASTNTSTASRQATITVSGTGVTSRTINATQQGSPTQSIIEMVYVQGGTFTMGCTSEQGNDCNDREKPAHQVTLSNYYIAKHVVTQALWREIMGSNPSYFKGDNLPVEQVTWNNVQIFITRLNAITGKEYRLPTEAEWEYAARGGASGKSYKYSGSNTVSDVAWYSDNSNNTSHPVGGKTPNELGIYDMSGNVFEWCNDRYNAYSSEVQTNPQGPSSSSYAYRVIRGGSWFNSAGSERVSFRSYYLPTRSDNDLGFRLARTAN